MENTSDVWHREVITPAAEQTLHELQHASVLTGFYLAGGTGLALQFGHRRSLDLDFFSLELFEEDAVLQQVQQVSGFSLDAKSPHTLHAAIGGVKVSFLGYAYPLLFPLKEFLSIRIAGARDIACMKLSAIASRGTRRDFVDLYAAANELGLPQLLELFHRKYAQARYNTVHILKSLTYFADAEKDPMPDMLIPLSWDEIKKFFLEEAPRLL